MTKKKVDEEKELNFEYNILGDTFIGALFNMDGEDNDSSQNLIISMESGEIQNAMKNKNRK